MKRFSRPRVIFLTMLLALLAVLAYGFAAQNTVGATYAGDGTGSVSGYHVAVGFTLDNSDPTKISAVTLALSDGTNALTAGTVKMQLQYSDGSTSSWVDCTTSNNTDWTCSISASVEPITGVRVIAVK